MDESQHAGRVFEPGETIRLERTLTEALVRQACEVTGDRGRWHVDDAFARECGFRGIIAPGLLTASLVTEFGGQINFLASRMEFEFLAPVHQGEAIVAEVEVTSYDAETRWLTAKFVVQLAGGKPVMRGRTEGFAGGPRRRRTALATGMAEYERACAHDRKGEEAEAIPCYQAALTAGLPPPHRADAMLGLGSSLRNVGRHAESVQLLRQAVREFPGNPALRAFLGLSLFSAGSGAEAVVELLGVAVDHAPLRGYERALAAYRDEIRQQVASTS